jgi:hypothetical protein
MLCEYCDNVFIGGSVCIVYHSITDSEIHRGWIELFFLGIKPSASNEAGVIDLNQGLFF